MFSLERSLVIECSDDILLIKRISEITICLIIFYI